MTENSDKPVAWMYECKADGERHLTFTPMADLPFNRARWAETPLYTRPTSAGRSELANELEAFMDSHPDPQVQDMPLLKKVLAALRASHCAGQSEDDARREAVQEVGYWFGTPTGESVDEYATKVREIVGLHQRLLRVAEAAQDFFNELQEDADGVPQPQLKAMLEALERYEVRALKEGNGE